MKELDEIDRLFQATFEEFELTPDPSVKENIDRAIASKKKRRKFIFFLLPIFFGTMTLAAFYFYSSSKDNNSNKLILTKNQPDNSTKNHLIVSGKTIQADKSNNVTSHNRTADIPSVQRQQISKTWRKSEMHSVATGSNPKNSPKFIVDSKPVLSETQTLLSTETNTDDTPLNEPLARAENQTQETSDKETSEEQKQDSTTTALLNDSVSDDIAEAAVEIPIVSEAADPTQKKWSLAIIAGWENEHKRPAENFDSTTFSGGREEFAQIHATTFYGKIELNRKLSNRVDIITGLGFRSSSVKQYGSLHYRDSSLLVEGVSSVPDPDSFAYFINNQHDVQTYLVNSITVPLGISFSIPVSQRLGFRLSGGTEFAYGWIANNQHQSEISRAKFRPFSWNAWLRPEINYTFGKFRLFGFGSFNQAIYQQLKWDFTPRRNPAFGVGIGLLIRL